MIHLRLLIAVPVAVLAVSCGPTSTPVPRGIDDEPVATEPALNGTSVTLGAPTQSDECWVPASINGAPAPYGCFPNGPLLSSTIAWVSLSAVTLAGGQALDGAAALGGTELSGTAGGAPVSGTGFVGATFTGTLTTGESVPIRIDSAAAGSGANADVWKYDFSYQDISGAWHSICADGGPAVPVLGRWDSHQGTAGNGAKTNDPTVFTPGCQTSAVSKCVAMGYKPWATVSGASLDAPHQACVRLIRADYCGDGVSHTSAGRSVNVYDAMGILSDTRSWLIEAEWTPAGARCVNISNRNLVGVLCAPLLSLLSCGSPSHFSTGTLLMSETELLSLL